MQKLKKYSIHKKIKLKNIYKGVVIMLYVENSINNQWKTKDRYDLIVVGAGPAGIGASIAAARRGLKVALIETFGFPGGVGTQSCCPAYFGFGVEGKQTTAGLSEEFIRKMDDLNAASFFQNNSPEYKPIGDAILNKIIMLDGEIMKLVYNRMLREAGVDCYFYTQMAEVLTKNNHICSILLSALEGTYLLEADTFIDATGNAQLGFLASPEAVNNCPLDEGMHNSMFFIVDGVKSFDINEAKSIYSQARKDGKLPEMVWPHFGFAHMLKPGMVQIAVCFEIGDGANSLEMTAMDQTMRENVFKVLDFLRKEMPGFENCYLTATPTKVGVRTSRNIVSVCDFSEELLLSNDFYHPVALCRRTYGMHSNSKNSFKSKWASYAAGIGAVPMEALISAKFDNLLASGRCIGSAPKLIETFRMMNTCMTTGEAAGLMAVVAKNNHHNVNAVTYEKLHPLLIENGFLLNV